MKYLLILFSMNLLISQNFEGFLRYDMKIETKDGSSEQLKNFGSLKESDSAIVVYTNGTQFLKYNYNPKLINIYDSETELIYSIEKGDKYLMTTDPKFGSANTKKDMKMQKSDSIFDLNEMDCKKVEFDFGNYKAIIYYSIEEKFNQMGKPFFYNSFIDYSIRNSFLKDRLIVRYIQEFYKVTTIVNLVELENRRINSKIFEIPEFKKSSKYDYDENEKFQVFKIKDKDYKFPDLSE